tara:strand:- start:2107 stop:2589 length:483 start_codon:yes stop_codon:yes gene_type:complete
MAHTVIDNFLDKNYFKTLADIIQSDNFPWFLQKKINGEDKTDRTYFTHLIYDKDTPGSDHYNSLLNVVILLQAKSLIRIKANCYLQTKKIIKHAFHTDYPFSHKGAILYLNTNNGKTILENGKEISSIANRVLLFDPSKKHQSTTCTNKQARFNINFNYF